VDKALARLRAAGARIALVGDPAGPTGIVTLKDLLEEISGPLAKW
jgi:CBS domain containing-hemolysin-like protein